jgi:hypothetical protein
MPIFMKQSRTVLYLHVPKTGGTAIQAFFEKNDFRADLLDTTGGPKSLNRLRRCPPQHMHAAQITAILRPSEFDFTFMTVRDPLARLLSEYKMRFRSKNSAPPLPAWVEQMFKRYIDNPFVADNHIRPQCEFWLPNCEVYRQEDRHGDTLAGRIEEKLELSLEHRTLGGYNIDEGTDIDQADIVQVEPLVRQFYRQDYFTFGY